jgi:DNA-directed RNA polymerase specialized sigma24 family protein
MISDTGMDEFIQKVASHATNTFPAYIDKTDVASELWVWYLDNEQTVTKLIRDNESWQPMLFTTMTRVANTYILTQDAATNGYSPEDAYSYSTAVVRELLKDAFDYDDWQSFSTFGDGQPKSKGLVNQTGDRMAMLADVKRGWSKLPERQGNIIFLSYRAGYSTADLAEYLGITEKGAESALRRAVGALRKKLGRIPLSDLQGGYSARSRAVGNAEANAIMDRQYNG